MIFFVFLNAGRYAVLLFLDLSAAFDTIDYSILFYCFKHWFGVSLTAFNLLSSFLSSRSQVVVTLKIKSCRGEIRNW